MSGREQAKPHAPWVGGAGSQSRRAEWKERFPAERAGVCGKQGCQSFPTGEEEMENRNSAVFVNDWKLHCDEKGEDVGSCGH